MWVKAFLIVSLVTLSGCSWKDFQLEARQLGDDADKTTPVVILPKDKVFSGTAIDCKNYEKRTIVGYKLAEWETRYGTYAVGPLGADNYIGVYGARKTSFWGYWLAVFAGRDIDDSVNTYGIGYMKTF